VPGEQIWHCTAPTAA
jgi:hypothetical protein